MSTFAVDIKKFTDKVKGREEVFLKELLLIIDKDVVYATPVDTSRARSNWNVGINNVDLTDHDPDGTQTVLDRAKAIIAKINTGDVVYISNNTDYIKFLEEGSSKQAPNGMVAITLQRLEQIAGEAIKIAKFKVP